MVLTKYDWLNVQRKTESKVPTYSVLGETMTVKQIAGLLGMTADGVRKRLKGGEDAETLVKRGRIRQRRK